MNNHYKYILDQYEDRKKLKWSGFHLSDHTAKLQQEKKETQFNWPEKEQLSFENIDAILYQAVLKNNPVAIQKNDINADGYHGPDTIGLIKGYDELGVYIEEELIPYNTIRHVEQCHVNRWFTSKKESRGD
ncbi:MAG: hypothetical protein ACTJHC_08585 [Vagococcus sp.]